MQKTSLIVINGNLSGNGFLTEQLSIDSLFDLVVGNQTFKDSIKKDFSSNEMAGFETVFTSALSDLSNLSDLKTVLNDSAHEWTSFRNVILYDAKHALVGNAGQLRLILKKLASLDSLALSADGRMIAVYPPAELQRMADATPLWSRNEISFQTLELPVDVLNLSKHLDYFTYFRSSSNTRHFNQIFKRGPYLIKRSVNKEKVEAEHALLSSVPNQIKPYFPMVGEISTSEKFAEYEIEYLPLLDSSRIFLHTKDTEKFCRLLLSRIGEYLALAPKQKLEKSEYAEKAKSAFIDKMNTREKQFLAMKDLEPVRAEIEKIIAEPIFALFQKARSAWEKNSSAHTEAELAWSHGDLCMSNILFDRQIGLMKFIDPRGAKTLEEAYLPALYDLAKLSHCFCGGYDFIVNDLSDVRYDAGLKVQIDFNASAEKMSQSKRIFKQWIEENGWNFRWVRICEATLFLSMLPLHADAPKRILQFAIAAKNILEEERE